MRALVLLVLASSSSYCGGNELFTILDESVDGIKDCREEGIETCQKVKVNFDVLRGRTGDIDDPEIGELQKLPTVLGNGDKESRTFEVSGIGRRIIIKMMLLLSSYPFKPHRELRAEDLSASSLMARPSLNRVREISIGINWYHCKKIFGS